MDRVDGHGPGDVGICELCGLPVRSGDSFVNRGPTDWNDAKRPKLYRWVDAATDIHGWTPFVILHPTCFNEREGNEALALLLDGTT